MMTLLIRIVVIQYFSSCVGHGCNLALSCKLILVVFFYNFEVLGESLGLALRKVPEMIILI